MEDISLNILKLPLGEFLGLELSDDDNYLLKIKYQDKLRNHLDSFHASSLFSFAEMSSGYFLALTFPREQHTTIPIIRRSQVKYSIRGQGTLYSKVHLIDQNVKQTLETLYNKGQIIIDLWVDVRDDKGRLVFSGSFEWFVKVKPEYLKISKTAVGA